ncbi:PAS domain S-box protein [Paenibacillus sp. P96]|uniref:histidine kinase n=1 Tax=Paenibacillus zeirhizosphaerae TaxID=2987519 RepID=A0ABT9FWZ4_9BACL|nr:ATP-binding protein [Paenibacillus sp. P96]MDP4099243.1 PAS domain S-box protein [Paenibacillus sp. P96]
MSIKLKLMMIMSAIVLVILLLSMTLNYYMVGDSLRRDSQSNMLLAARQIESSIERSLSTIDKVEDVPNFEDMLEQMQKNDPRYLEITGIDPATFTSPSRTDGAMHAGILFGTYQQGQWNEDRAAVAEAIRTGESVMLDSRMRDKKVLKGFIPFDPPGRDPYVMRIVMSYQHISSLMRELFCSSVVISSVLLVIVICGSYVLACYFTRPVQSILEKVNKVASGEFDTQFDVTGNDELAQLSSRIDIMAFNQGLYTRRLEQMYEENRAVKEHLESVINQTADAIHVTDTEDVVVRVNQAFEDLYGWHPQEVIGKRLNLVPEELKETYEDQRQRLLKGESISSTESVHLRKDGSRVEVSISIAPIHDEEKGIVGLISVTRDMTSRNRMEELLRRSEKLTTVGQLAAGVAHEIRNPLTTLRGFLQIQQQTGTLNVKHVDLMLSELDRINLIVGEFLILAKPQAVQFQRTDIRCILEDVISLLDSQAHLCGVEFHIQVTNQPTAVFCAENQLKQVFINLLKNAIEAMPNGGRISIELCLYEENVKIVIKDEGTGMSPEVMAKLGEPFFTKKDAGTGLGLMVSQRIIQSHKGLLDMESIEGEGTTVTILLPWAACAKDAGTAGEAGGGLQNGV